MRWKLCYLLREIQILVVSTVLLCPEKHICSVFKIKMQPATSDTSMQANTVTHFRYRRLSLYRFNRYTGYWHSEDRASWYILTIKPTRRTISQIYFWNRTLHVSDSFSVNHQESSTVHTAIGICHTGYAECFPVYIAVCTVPDSWWWTEKQSETCRVLFQK